MKEFPDLRIWYALHQIDFIGRLIRSVNEMKQSISGRTGNHPVGGWIRWMTDDHHR